MGSVVPDECRPVDNCIFRSAQNHEIGHEFLKLNGELQWHRSPKIGLTKNLRNGNKERGSNGDIFRHQRNICFSIKPWII